MTRDGLANELQREKQQEILIDSFISQSRRVEMERELEPWVPEDDEPRCPELENTFDGHWDRLLNHSILYFLWCLFIFPQPLLQQKVACLLVMVVFESNTKWMKLYSKSN